MTVPSTWVEEAVREKPEDVHAADARGVPGRVETTTFLQVIPAGKVWLTLALSSVTDPLLVRVNVALTLPSAIAWDVRVAASLNSMRGSSTLEWDRTTSQGWT